MQATFQATEAFSYSADLRQIEALPGAFSLTITSLYTGAKAPAPRVVFQATLDRTGLLALRDLIDGEVAA